MISIPIWLFVTFVIVLAIGIIVIIGIIISYICYCRWVDRENNRLLGEKRIAKLTDEMLKYASEMEFEKAAKLRDQIKELEKLL